MALKKFADNFLRFTTFETRVRHHGKFCEILSQLLCSLRENFLSSYLGHFLGDVALHLNRRLRSQVIHDLNTVNYCTLSAGRQQEGILITYPTASELAASTLAYAVAKKRCFSELHSALPILIAIGLKQRPETSEIKEFRSAFRLIGLGRRGVTTRKCASCPARPLGNLSWDTLSRCPGFGEGDGVRKSSVSRSKSDNKAHAFQLGTTTRCPSRCLPAALGFSRGGRFQIQSNHERNRQLHSEIVRENGRFLRQDTAGPCDAGTRF
jgi:hypothetical protein